MDALDTSCNIARQFEGLRLLPYLCPAGIPTIGYGATRYETGKKVTLQDPPITKDRAEELLMWEMQKCLLGSMKYCPGLIKSNNRWAAIADFCFNLGVGRLQTSTLRIRINEEDWPEAKKELLRWVRGGGRILSGLVKRRVIEAALI